MNALSSSARSPSIGANDARWSWHRIILIFTLVGILARMREFGNPIVFTDEEFYLHVARKMWHGALPYVDIWDRKPIGLFLLYMPAAAFPLGASVYAYQAMALAAVVATAGLIVAAARRGSAGSAARSSQACSISSGSIWLMGRAASRRCSTTCR